MPSTLKNYITDLVGRFLRPEPHGTEINDTDKTNSTPVNDEPLESCHKKRMTTEEGEDVHVVLASSAGSTRPVILWDTGSELQPEMRQNVLQEHEKIKRENDDGKRQEEIETGIDAASALLITTTIDNAEQSSDITKNGEELMPKMLVDCKDEMIDKVCSEADKPQSKEQLNEILKGFNKQNTYSEITSKLDTITAEQKHYEQHDEKLLPSDNMDLKESGQIIEKQDNVGADGNIKSESGGNKNAVKVCLQTTHLEVTRQNDMTARSDDMNNENIKKTHTLVLGAENLCKQDDISEVYEGNKDDNLDMENLERPFDVETSMSDKDYIIVFEEDEKHGKQELTLINIIDDSANVKTENEEKESEITEHYNENMTNQNAMFDTEEEDDAKECKECPALFTTDDSANAKSENDEKEKEIQKEEIKMTENDDDQNRDQDMTPQYTLEVVDDESSTEESKDMKEDDLNKLHTSLVLETEHVSKQDDKNEVHDGDEDDMVMAQNNQTMGNLERLPDVGSSVSDKDHVIALEEDEKQELTVANTTDDSANVKSENDEKEKEIQKEEIEMKENYDDYVTNQNAIFGTADGDNAKETCPALILDQDMTPQYTLEVVDDESSTEESKDMKEDYLNKLHTSLVLETEHVSKQDDKNEVHDGDEDDMVMAQNNQDMGNLERLPDVGSSVSDKDHVIALEEDEKQELTVANTTDDSANVKSENDEKEKEIQKEEIEMKENEDDQDEDKDMTPQYTLEVVDDGSSTEESKDMNEDDLNKLHTSLGLETENMSKQDGKNEDEKLEKQELTAANTTDDSANIKSENDEKEKEIQKEEIEMKENYDDYVTNQNAIFGTVDGDNAKETCPALILDQDMTPQYTLEVIDDESSTEESKDMNEDYLNKLHTSLVLETEHVSKQDNKNEVHDWDEDDMVMAQNNQDMGNLERLPDVGSSVSDKDHVIELEEDEKQELTVANTTDDSANVKSENDEKEKEIQKEEIEMKENKDDQDEDKDMTPQYTLEVVDDGSSTEESKDMNEDDLNKLHTSLGLETENMSKQDDKNEDEKLEKQELTAANTTDDSANIKSENDEKESEIQKEDNEITEHYNDKMTMVDAEYGDNAIETCPALNIDQDMSQPYGKSSTEESKDMNDDDLNKLHIFGGLETETLNILGNQDEYSKEQVTDGCVILQEVEPSTSKQEYTAANGSEESYDNRENKKSGKMEQDIFEKECNNSDLNSKVITSNMEDAANVGLETVSRYDLDLEGILSIADLAPSEMDRSMGKFCVTIKNEGGPTQEQAIAFKNIPPGEGEGQERPYSYKESREEVPDYNNESDNGSATQRFLEVGNCRENHTTLLQEEVVSGAVIRLQNSGTNEGEETLEDLMATELIKNSLEEHIAENTQLPDNLMKTASEYTNFETNFISEDVEEKEDLKEAEREIGFEMGKGLCDTDTADDGLEIQTQFQTCIFLDQNKCNIQTMERSFVENQTTRVDLSAVEDLFTFEEQDTTVKTITNGSSESVKSGSADEDVHEHCTTVSNDNVIPDVVHHEISPNALSVEDEHPKCVVEQQIFDDVIENEILDLRIQHTSIESSKVREGDQGHEDSKCDVPEEEKVESIPELSITCDVNVSLSTTESDFFDLSMDMGAMQHDCSKEEQELLKEEQIINVTCALNKSEDLKESSIAQLELETPWREDMGTTPKSRNVEEEEAITSQNTDSIMSVSTTVMQDNSPFSIPTDVKPFTTSGMLSEPDTLSKDQSDSLSEVKNTIDTTDTSEIEVYPFLLQDKSEVEALQDFEESGLEHINKVNVSEFDFTPQKSRIAVKNPRVRPPKDFRSLLHKPSLEPSPSKPLASCVPAGVPIGSLGIGIKLPGIGTGFPVLKKTKKTIEEETKTTIQETKPMLEDGDNLKPEDSQQRPKWMPPSRPGFGNPLMSELKSKLKKTMKE
ncbi:kinesin-related protein 4 isoform X2 [Boleophthalmus pectinirostris]|uniref:kinesin-related protein 4 isoform X2 n=1 Tax=Boleophthalmus pectinirostris TaxID=150288 RepID=UPI00242F333C|nr:kinesin-related protein 4 isoform X2 [Boleophthalmus pectinirostris]